MKRGFSYEIGIEDRVDFEILVPLSAIVVVKTSKGHISISNTSGVVDILTRTGDIAVSNFEGSLFAPNQRWRYLNS